MAKDWMTGESWWYWQEYILLPFREKVGTGKSSYWVVKNSYDELRHFLRSDESLYMFANSQVDIAVFANMLNLNIWTLTYNRKNGQKPSWSQTCPDPELSLYSMHNNRPPMDVALFHAEDCHYDLLVAADSRTAVTLAGLPNTITLATASEDSAPPSTTTLHPPPTPAAVQRTVVEHLAPVISPLNFVPCPRGPGRPKIRREREGAPSIAKRKSPETEPISSVVDFLAPKAKKQRGRPPGSKNRPKIACEVETVAQRQRAENSADPDFETSFLDMGDICNICHFPLKHPVKREKKTTKCTICGKIVHVPCLKKSPCNCSLL